MSIIARNRLIFSFSWVPQQL